MSAPDCTITRTGHECRNRDGDPVRPGQACFHSARLDTLGGGPIIDYFPDTPVPLAALIGSWREGLIDAVDVYRLAGHQFVGQRVNEWNGSKAPHEALPPTGAEGDLRAAPTSTGPAAPTAIPPRAVVEAEGSAAQPGPVARCRTCRYLTARCQCPTRKTPNARTVHVRAPA